MALMLVTGLVILIVLIVGIIKVGLCVVFPILKPLFIVAMVLGWPLALWWVYTNGPEYVGFERVLLIVVVSVVYWVIMLAIKLLLVPINMLGKMLDFAKEPKKHARDSFQEQEQNRVP